MAGLESVVNAVRGMIARTSSSSEHEAATCAKLACQKIRDHGLVVVDPASLASLADVALLQSRLRESEAVIAKLRETISLMVAERQRAQASSIVSEASTVSVRPSPEVVANASRSLASEVLGKIGGSRRKRVDTKIPFIPMPDSGRIVEADRDRRCRSCRKRIRAGENVFWTPGSDAVICMRCAEDE